MSCTLGWLATEMKAADNYHEAVFCSLQKTNKEKRPFLHFFKNREVRKQEKNINVVGDKFCKEVDHLSVAVAVSPKSLRKKRTIIDQSRDNTGYRLIQKGRDVHFEFYIGGQKQKVVAHNVFSNRKQEVQLAIYYKNGIAGIKVNGEDPISTVYKVDREKIGVKGTELNQLGAIEDQQFISLRDFKKAVKKTIGRKAYRKYGDQISSVAASIEKQGVSKKIVNGQLTLPEAPMALGTKLHVSVKTIVIGDDLRGNSLSAQLPRKEICRVDASSEDDAVIKQVAHKLAGAVTHPSNVQSKSIGAEQLKTVDNFITTPMSISGRMSRLGAVVSEVSEDQTNCIENRSITSIQIKKTLAKSRDISLCRMSQDENSVLSVNQLIRSRFEGQDWLDSAKDVAFEDFINSCHVASGEVKTNSSVLNYDKIENAGIGDADEIDEKIVAYSNWEKNLISRSNIFDKYTPEDRSGLMNVSVRERNRLEAEKRVNSNLCTTANLPYWIGIGNSNFYSDQKSVRAVTGEREECEAVKIDAFQKSALPNKVVASFKMNKSDLFNYVSHFDEQFSVHRRGGIDEFLKIAASQKVSTQNIGSFENLSLYDENAQLLIVSLSSVKMWSKEGRRNYDDHNVSNLVKMKMTSMVSDALCPNGESGLFLQQPPEFTGFFQSPSLQVDVLHWPHCSRGLSDRPPGQCDNLWKCAISMHQKITSGEGKQSFLLFLAPKVYYDECWCDAYAHEWMYLATMNERPPHVIHAQMRV